MVRAIRGLRAVLALVWAASCASDAIPGPPSGLSYAAVIPACGPADGPAIAIYLSPNPVELLDPSPPFVRIDVRQPLERLGERPWTLTDGSAAAGTTRQRTRPKPP